MEAYRLSPTLLTREASASPKVKRSDTFGEALASRVRSETFSLLLLSNRVNCFVVPFNFEKKT